MQPSQNTSKSLNLLAALIFFTRLPFWKIREVPAACFQHVVPYWPFAGWLTGGVMAGVLWITAQAFPLPVAWLLTIASRLLLTGCLHEDGLADFLDGLGGGHSREQALAIMKDSHIGSFGVIGLAVYLLLMWQAACFLPLPVLLVAAFCGDSWSKCCAAQLINCLPYARKQEESKAKTVYSRMSQTEVLFTLAAGLLPLAILIGQKLWPAALFPPLAFAGLCWLMKKRLNGYTGDCCGATFLVCELSFYLGILLLYHS